MFYFKHDNNIPDFTLSCKTILGGKMTKEEIENRFTYHAPKPGQPEIYQDIRTLAKELALDINEFVPEGREKSLAFTKLEEAVMWANAGIARHG